MAKPKKDDQEVPPDAAPEGAAIEPGALVRVRIRHYKVKTSQGRFLDGDIAWLPSDEAARLIADGMAVKA